MFSPFREVPDGQWTSVARSIWPALVLGHTVSETLLLFTGSTLRMLLADCHCSYSGRKSNLSGLEIRQTSGDKVCVNGGSLLTPLCPISSPVPRFWAILRLVGTVWSFLVSPLHTERTTVVIVTLYQI